MTTVTIQTARSGAEPRGARWAAADAFAAVWRSVAAAFKLPPRRPLNRFEEAAQVRALAASVVDCDPGFAADLYAAAARHESFED